MDPKFKAFLDLIAWSEGTSTSSITQDNGYDVNVTGIDGPSRFDSYEDHPFAKGGHIQWHSNPDKFSTAAGRYQILARYWNIYKVQLNLRDFSPASQDAVALQMMKERGAISDLIDCGDPQGAIYSCSKTWASFPGNNYGQGGHSITELLGKYNELLRG
jgi:muramidase (phage lysozyme)